VFNSRLQPLPNLRLLALLATAPLLAATQALPPAKASESATVREILDGNQLFIDARQAKVNETALSPQQISTQNSRGQLLFRSGAAARINRFTQLRLGKSCFLLAKGQVLISGKENGCTKSLRLSSRGTNYLISLNDDGTVDVIVLEGTVETDQLLADDPSTANPAQLGTLLEMLNRQRDQIGNPEFKAVPETVQAQINAYGSALINAMKASGGCLHGTETSVGSPFAAVKLPGGWSVLGEVLGCSAEAGVWTPESLSRVWWNSPVHQRIVFLNQKANAIGCVWSKPQTRSDTEIIVCLTLKEDGSTPVVPSPVVITAGYRVRFSSDGKVLSTVKLGPDDYNSILKGPLFAGFVTSMPEFAALYQYISETMKGVVLPPTPGS